MHTLYYYKILDLFTSDYMKIKIFFFNVITVKGLITHNSIVIAVSDTVCASVLV